MDLLSTWMCSGFTLSSTLVNCLRCALFTSSIEIGWSDVRHNQRGIRVLIYLGTYDWQCNASANKLWVERLEWSGQAEYLINSWRNWTVGGKKVGDTKSSGLLTVATVDGAGHMISRFHLQLTAFTDGRNLRPS